MVRSAARRPSSSSTKPRTKLTGSSESSPSLGSTRPVRSLRDKHFVSSRRIPKHLRAVSSIGPVGNMTREWSRQTGRRSFWQPMWSQNGTRAAWSSEGWAKTFTAFCTRFKIWLPSSVTWICLLNWNLHLVKKKLGKFKACSDAVDFDFDMFWLLLAHKVHLVRWADAYRLIRR